MNFIYKIQKFMQGRYGTDDLYKFLFIIYIIIFITNLILNSIILTILQIIIIFITFYRFFSKKIYKRRKENEIYLKIKNKISKPFINIKRNIKDKNNIYKKCNKCKTTLKLKTPMKRGIKTTTCPSCGNKIKMLVLKKVKIEVIRNK